jgi:gamma-glutamylcyclotransferase (GGCT)/AIG2-like uncharacterized protein YtfP
MPLLFSYGSLRREDVQIATFGRPLARRPDELVGFDLVPADRSGTGHANVVPGAVDSRVAGFVFEISDAELTSADEYERRDGYTRVAGPLRSGQTSWVYVSRSTT